MSADSGVIALANDLIRYEAPAATWQLRVSDVRVIGEATNPCGPFIDDYFLYFVTAAPAWLEASFYADGRDDFLAALSARFGAPIELGLASTTTFADRVMWPPPLLGAPLFKAPDANGASHYLGFARSQARLSDEVTTFLLNP